MSLTRILVLALVLLTLVRACSPEEGKPPSPVAQVATHSLVELGILEAVFRHQIQHCYSDRKPTLYFVSYQEEDPPQDLLDRLKVSSATVGPRSQMRSFHDKDTGAPGILLAVQTITLLNETEAEVTGSCGAAALDASSYVFHVVLNGGTWVVSSSERTGVS